MAQKDSDLRQALDEVVLDSLRPLSSGLAALSTLIMIPHWRLLPEVVRTPVLVADSLLAAGFLLLRLALARRSIPSRYGNPIAAGIAILLVIHLLVISRLGAENLAVVLLLILLIGVGCFQLSVRWLALSLLTVLGASTAVLMRSITGSEFVVLGFAVLTATTLAVIIFVARLRSCKTLHRTLTALKRSEERYRSLFEDSPDVIIISSPEGRVEDCNPASARLFGYETQEEDSRVYTVDRLCRDPAERDELLRRVAVEGCVKDYELVLKDRHGKELVVLDTATAARDAKGQIVGYREILRDVTGQRELERQFQKAQTMAAVARLVGGLAHDFNNILTVVAGHADLLLKRFTPDESSFSNVLQIQKAGERAAALVQQLLAFSRQTVLQPKVLDLNVAVTEFESLLRSALGEDIELVTNLDSRLELVKADPGQIERVLMNLAVNARDAMQNGGRLTIESANAELDEEYASQHLPVEPGRYVMLSVSDTGTGMDKTTQGRIFEPFFTTKEKGKGTGLGLSSVYGIVKQSGGYIWVYSEPGSGTVFRIYLPCWEEALDEARARPVPPQPAPDRPSETILVVDDDDRIRRMVSSILADQGYTILTARHPDEALDLLNGHDDGIRLLITDLVLPKMSGLELVQRVTRLRPEAKVLTISGFTDKAALSSDPLETDVPFLAKPFGSATLAQKVREVLNSETVSGSQ